MFQIVKKNAVLAVSLFIVGLFSIIAFFKTAETYSLIEELSIFVRSYFGKYYLYLGLFCVLFLFVIAFTKLGKHRLGLPDSRPEFSRLSWIAMLYSTGMGAGILLRAVQEPVYMYLNPPISINRSQEIIALEYTFYQWGFTAWAFYAIFALIIGYYIFRKKRPMKTSAVFNSANKDNTLSFSVDILVVITTIFGLIGALTLGTTQIQGGINYLTDSTTSQLVYRSHFVS